MAAKREALVEENRHLLAENDALRAEIVSLKGFELKVEPRAACLRLG
jgi:hypothetical protein